MNPELIFLTTKPVAGGEMHPGEEACEEVHPRDRLLQGAQGALCAPWVRIQKCKRTHPIPQTITGGAN